MLTFDLPSVFKPFSMLFCLFFGVLLLCCCFVDVTRRTKDVGNLMLKRAEDAGVRRPSKSSSSPLLVHALSSAMLYLGKLKLYVPGMLFGFSSFPFA